MDRQVVSAHLPPSVDNTLFGITLGVVGLAWLNVLSVVLTIIATVLAGAWSAVKLWESKTVQRWLRRRRRA